MLHLNYISDELVIYHLANIISMMTPLLQGIFEDFNWSYMTKDEFLIQSSQLSSLLKPCLEKCTDDKPLLYLLSHKNDNLK